MAEHIDRQQLRHLWEQALAEDGADHDVTSLVAVNETAIGAARIVMRRAGTFAGSAIFDLLREAYDRLYETVVHRSKEIGGNQHPFWKGHVRGSIVLSARCAETGPIRSTGWQPMLLPWQQCLV